MFELKPLSTGIEVITLRWRSLYSLNIPRKNFELIVFQCRAKNDNLELRIFCRVAVSQISKKFES